jgi:sulfide:quinone oxidoreductase
MRRAIHTKVVVVGGGVAALELVLALRRLSDDRAQIQVVTPERDFVYRPLAVAEPFGLATARHFSLDRLLAEHGAARHAALVERIDPERHEVITAGGGRLDYDVLAITVGATAFEAVPAALTVGVGDGFTRLRAALERLAPGEKVLIVIPGGTSWTLPAYELALLTRVSHPSSPVAIVTPEDAPLAVFGQAASHEVALLLEERSIEFHPGSHPMAVEGDELRRVGEPPVDGDLIIALPGLRGPALAGLPHDPTGFIRVDGHCRVLGVDDVFAAGDATAFPIKQGGIAAQQAVIVAKAIAADMGLPVTRTEFEPVLRGLLLTGGIPEYLRADIARGMGVYHSEAALEPIWWPPNKIATEHLSQVLALIAAAEPLPTDDPFMRVETDDVEHLLKPES